MPLNAGEAGCGSGLSCPGSPGPRPQGPARDSETTPLLMPEPEADPAERWQPLSKEELEVAAGGPRWRRLRLWLVVLFWLAWLAMLATSVAIIAMSPRPVATPLRWWQKSVFYELQPKRYMDPDEGPQGINVLCEQLPYFRSLGIGALILQGLFAKVEPRPSLTVAGESLGTLPQIQHLLTESNRAGLKVVLDFCGLNGTGPTPSNLSATAENSLWFWLEQGVAGFAICDTDAAYSEKTLLEWRGVFREYSSEEERIVLVKQTRDALLPLNDSGHVNKTLVDVVVRSILPPSDHPLSAQEVAVAVETHLQTSEREIWPSWTLGGEATPDLKKLLLVLMMTLPGSPAVQYDEDIDQTKSVSLNAGSSHGEKNEPSDSHAEKEKHSAVALFTSLSHSREREEALLYGSFTFLPFNTSTRSAPNSTLASPPPPTILAFLRSWGCVHFLVLLNLGPELHALDPAWAPSLPQAGVFVTSTGMDRLGSTTLYSLELRPHEAIVIKLFEAGSYS